MKLWSSMRQQAAKVAFEADRMMRVKHEESAISGLRSEIQTAQVSLGQIALALYREGTLANPKVAEFAQQISRLEESIRQHEETIVAMRAEQPPAEGEQPVAQPPQPAAMRAAPEQMAPPPAGPPAPMAPAAEVQPQESAGRACANCGASVPANAAFCPECGTRMS